eukprot:2950028-Prymnesium_polylepis.1
MRVEDHLQVVLAHLPHVVHPRVDRRGDEGLDAATLHRERAAVSKVLGLDLQRERRSEAFSVVAPRAHGGFALERGEARGGAMVLAEDAAVWAVVGELLQPRQVVVAMEDADGRCALRQMLARAHFGRFLVEGRFRRRLAVCRAVLTCFGARREAAMFRTLGHVLVDVKFDRRRIVARPLLLQRDLVLRALLAAAEHAVPVRERHSRPRCSRVWCAHDAAEREAGLCVPWVGGREI